MDNFLKYIGWRKRTLTEFMIKYALKFKTPSTCSIIRENNKRVGKVTIFVTPYSYKFVFSQVYDVAKSLNISNELAECPVCYEDTNSYLNNCNHTLCRECMIKIIKKSDFVNFIYCPLCRKKACLENYVIVREL
jgi:hypothetical protein